MLESVQARKCEHVTASPKTCGAVPCMPHAVWSSLLRAGGAIWGVWRAATHLVRAGNRPKLLG
eukprot:4688485-Alexandrium_andersonii.AAC.1